MPNLVTDGTTCSCSFGTLPAVLSAGPSSTGEALGMKVLTEMMIVANTNIPPFGMCSSLANPAVASATSAAMGALTPQPCTPMVAAPWSPAATNTTILNQKAVTELSKCTCSYGGVISIVKSPNTLGTSV